ncbi:hypothetical protein GX51_07890 [Blastomyces parvus]|uniref:SWIM-type domain-containing protein n=1 Tax=Blastomyces parvus TaxID=2060905 RepID=A0A2B7WIF9_9EURO|nr:hypothetical protein GX51_07890 [Blastomyces parvus]
MGSALPKTPQIITSIVYQLSKIHPSPPPPPDQNNNSTQRQNHNPPSTETNNSNNNPLAQLPGPVLSKVKPLLLTLHCLFPNELLLALDILDRKGIKRYEYHVDEDDVYDRDQRSGEAEQQQYRRGENIDRGIYLVHSSSAAAAAAAASFSSSSSGMNTTRPNANNTANTHPPKTKTHHLVCLNAWHCSCPAFTLAAFRDPDPDSPDPTTTTRTTAGPETSSHNEGEEEDEDERNNNNNPSSTSISTPAPAFPFGGTLTRDWDDSMERTTHQCHSTPVCKHLLACLLGSQCSALFGHGVERVCVGGDDHDHDHDDGWERELEAVMAGRFALV